MTAPKVLFDFDGVLIDSIEEMVFTAYNSATGRLALTDQEIPEAFRANFLKYRYLLQPAGDLLLFAKWCLTQETEAPFSLEVLRQLRANDPRSLKDRTRIFFEARDCYIERARDGWFQLHRPFEPLWGGLRELGAEEVVILTNKNRSAVMDLCRYFGMTIPEENVYSGDNGVTKIESFSRIEKRFGAGEYVFIDDSILNLEEMKHHDRLILRLATWGYIGPEDRGRAERAGFSPLDQAEALRLAFDFSGNPR